MAGPNYNSFAEALDLLTTKEGETWSNVTDSLGENPLNDVWASTQSEKESFTTEHIAYNFKNIEIAEFLATYPAIAALKFKVKYSFDCTKGGGASISLQPYVAIDGGDLELNSQIVNGIINDDSEGSIKTAVVSFYLNNIPVDEKLSSDKFDFVLSFDGTNPLQETVEIRVYSIEIEIVNSTEVGYLLAVTESGFVMEDKDSTFLPDIINQPGGDKFYLYNVGDTKVIIPQGGISSEKGYITFESESWPTVVTEISKGEFLPVSFEYFSQTQGSNEDTVSVESDALISQFTFSYQFSVTSIVQDLFSTITPSYQNNVIGEGSSFSLSSFPIGITKVVTVRVYNTGTSSLIISSVTIGKDGNLSSGSIGSGTVIPPSFYGNININLSTNVEGSKSVSVQIVSNSRTNSVYNFTLTYAVLQQSKIEFSEGFSSGSSNSVLVDGQETDFGTVERDRPLSRYFVLKNSGIYKSLIINSVSSSSPSMPLSGLPSFPYTLIPNNGNAMTFSVSFETSEVGLKEGILSIDYVEGSVYTPPTSSPPSVITDPGDIIPIGPGGV